MRDLTSICVYCGSSDGADPVFVQTARALGEAIGAAGLTLVYGGGSNGLMGVVARSARAAGAKVTGIIPDFLLFAEGDEVRHDLRLVVPDMHTRKREMFERADAFVALPGGIGTLEELVEMMTWAQLGRHGKPVLVADIAGFWRPFLDLLDHMRDHGFLRQPVIDRTLVVGRVEDVIPTLRAALAKEPDVPALKIPIERLS